MEDYPTRDEVADGSFADGVRFAAEFDGDHNELADKVDEIAETDLGRRRRRRHARSRPS